jgi:hypothetical protein
VSDEADFAMIDFDGPAWISFAYGSDLDAVVRIAAACRAGTSGLHGGVQRRHERL